MSKTSRKNPYRLSGNVVPSQYALSLDLIEALKQDAKKHPFFGNVAIDLKVKKPTYEITLHAVGLDLSGAVLNTPNGRALLPAKITRNKKFETVTLHFPERISSGAYLLKMSFLGEVSERLRGLYGFTYEVNGEKHRGLGTQLEATEARYVFPCFDEPAMKATFALALRVPKELVAISNNNQKADDALKMSADSKLVVFDPTPVMSSYLLAFTVARYEYVEAIDKNGVPHRVYTTPGKENTGQFALEVSRFTLPFFAKHCGVPYMGKKLDMVGLPSFEAGAMENLGAVFFRETALLFDPKNSSAAVKQRIAEVVAHELAYMWYGDLVTMEYWEDLWLNESFATYMAFKANLVQFPEWDLRTNFTADDYLSALHLDALINTHPIQAQGANSPAEITENFDAISYSKGASVLNMLGENLLNDKTFWKALRIYFKRHGYGNATSKDLWRAFEEASGKPVEKIMSCFTRQSGYPVVIVREEEKGGNTVLHLRQKRFLADGSTDRKDPMWMIPMKILQGDGTVTPHLMTEKAEAFFCLLKGKPLHLNHGQAGFYRVAYSENMWLRLGEEVKSGRLSPAERLVLLDDAFALARAGYAETKTALTLLENYRGETHYNIWQLIAQSIHSLHNLLSYHSPAAKEMIRAFGRNFFADISAQCGWKKKTGEGHLDALLRGLTLGNAGQYGDPAVLAAAKNRFTSFVDGGELDPDLRGVVYGINAQNDGETAYPQLLELYTKHKAGHHEEARRALSAMGNVQHPKLVGRYLDFSLSGEVGAQDTPFVLAWASGDAESRTIAWEFAKKNWKMYAERYKGSHLASHVVNVIAGTASAEELKDARGFFRKNPIPGTERTAKQAIEAIALKVNWLRRDGDAMVKWLESH